VKLTRLTTPVNGSGSLAHSHFGLGVTGRVGASGSQAAAFETVITVDDYLHQVSGADLSEKWYTAYIVPPEAV